MSVYIHVYNYLHTTVCVLCEPLLHTSRISRFHFVSCVGVMMPFLPLATTLPANITPHKPPLGRPPKRPSTESSKMGSQTAAVTMETPVSKRPRLSQPTEKETPKVAKLQGVRRRAAASARQHRLKELSDSDGGSEDSMDSLNASWHSFSSGSLSLVSLDADERFLDDEEGAELPKQVSSPGQPSGRGRVYNRYCSGHKDDVIHCMCSSFKEEGFMIQVTLTSQLVRILLCMYQSHNPPCACGVRTYVQTMECE